MTIYIGMIIAGILLFFILKSPYKYPYFVHYFDVSGKRKPQKEDLLDKFLNEGNFYLIEQLKEINSECTLREYHSKNQRKLMTKELRKKIMTRDNYTCKLCGKYMPDEVGLHIDHIIPISKGGKTIVSNLQVLCSKCNGHKSDMV